MVELSRKQREMEQRAAEILRVARPILIAEGFQSLSMDRVASQMEYAKGTIYNHFPNKEEIVLALAVESMELRRTLFEQSSHVPGPARFRMMALGAACEFFTQHCTDDFLVEQCIRNQSIWDKSSERRQSLIRQCEGQCMGIVAGIVRDAVARNELVIPEGLTPEEFVFGFWAINYGSQILTYSSPSLPAIGINDPFNAIRVHCCTLLNGFSWQPTMMLVEYNEFMSKLNESLQPKFWTLKKQQQSTN
jgi:AcrR family transcriptional regulator